MDRIEQIETALSVPQPEVYGLTLEDSRRVTGPGMMWKHPGAILDVFSDRFDSQKMLDLWAVHARVVLDALGWADQHLTGRAFEGGVTVALSAPMDQLYSAVFAAETAWHRCACDLSGVAPNPIEDMISDVQRVMMMETDPALVALINAASERGLDILCDDDEVSVGHGDGSRTWPVQSLPAPEDVNWSELHDIPVAMITGTNGKTTTTRLCAAIVRAAGLIEGLTSTDVVQVGGEVLDRGDYSGPGGARLLLRDKRLEFACLEVARGGILRRGLATSHVGAAVVTNVAADHLGQYGVNTVPGLAQAKFAVHRALKPGGILALNADDPNVVVEADRTDARICWFSSDAANPLVVAALHAGQPCAWSDGSGLWHSDGGAARLIAQIDTIPVAMGGAALYNVQNALGALCVTTALGIPDAAIRNGLQAFRPDPRDNPGRLNEFAVNDARVFVDFAHNPHSVAAVSKTMAGIPAKRRFVLLSHAGDRSDRDIRDVTKTALELQPDYVMAVDLEGYLRGRSMGEIPSLIRETCLSAGMSEARILQASSPLVGTEQIVSMLQPGDLALLLILAERDQVFEMLETTAG